MLRSRAILAAVLVFLPAAASSQTPQGLPAIPVASCASKANSTPVVGPMAPAAYADPSIDVTYYRLDLRVAPPSGAIQGRVLVRARSLADSLTTVGLDLMNTMTVDSVVAGGIALSFTHYPAVLIVDLDRPYARNELLSVEVSYHGVPVPTGFGSFKFSQHEGTPWVWSLSQPYGARDWWPCKDHPIDKADSADIVVTCPRAFRVGSNGQLADITLNGDGTHTVHWTERYPIATYLVSIAVTNYAEFTNWFHYTPSDSMPVVNYVLPEHLELASEVLPDVVTMLTIFSEAYGTYPFIKEKYGHSEFGMGGAMEHQTMTSTTSFDQTVLAHELAHQWFGDLITCRTWQHLWLNEGFASYSEAIFFERRYGQIFYHSKIAYRMDLALQSTASLFVLDTSSIGTLFDNRLVYSKGASVLHMLRHILGDSVFFSALRAYVADPLLRYGTATTEDFQRACEFVSGRSLGWFFQEWVYGERFPTYSYAWDAIGLPKGYEVTIRLDQTTGTSNPAFFVMPVDLRLAGKQWDTIVTVQHAFSGQTFTVQTSLRPDTVDIDPERWILCKVVPPSQLLPMEFAIAQNYPNPFNAGTTVRYALPHRQHVAIRVYTLLGQEVTTLVDGTGEPGSRTVLWDGTRHDGTAAASGVYLCRFESGGVSRTVKMVLLR